MAARSLDFRTDALGDYVAVWIGYEDLTSESYEKGWKQEILEKLRPSITSGLLKHSFGSRFYSYQPEGKAEPEAVGFILPKFIAQAVVDMISGSIT